MRKIHIFNPKAGKGHAPALLTDKDALRDEYYITTGVGDCTRYVESVCAAAPDTHFIVYGGDGTLNEAVTGIMRAGAGDKALLSIVPLGTGNDFLRTLKELGEKGDTVTVDVLRVGDGYGVNIVNTGFDCNVVDKTQHYKTLPMVTGGGAYVLGVCDVLMHRLGQEWELSITAEDGTVELYRENGLLALFANGRYYGGGFRAAPAADPRDGLMDVLLVRKVTRLQFISLVGAYRKGTHIAQDGTVLPKFAPFVEYRRARAATITGITRLCADGETEDQTAATLSVIPGALRFFIL